MSNSGAFGNSVLGRGLQYLAERLPPRWSIARADQRPRNQNAKSDGILEIRAPDGTRSTIIVEATVGLTAVEARALAGRLDQAARDNGASGRLVVTTFLSALARERLRAAGVSYLDLTGNAHIVLDRPGLVIELHGADRDPAPERKEKRTLKGGAAARIVRALADWDPPVGVRELARRAGINAGYATRILTLLMREDVIARNTRGVIMAVRWRDLLRRWAQDYGVFETNRAVAYLAPRGIPTLLERLTTYDGRWALTGSAAVPRAAAVATIGHALIYVDNVEEASAALGLRAVDSGANAILLEPFDSVIWERTRQDGGRVSVAVSQCAVDLLTGSGRQPGEAEALLDWMAKHEVDWRNRSQTKPTL